MPEKFQNKFRVPSSRAQWWNYADAAAYFVTVCTANMTPFFGYVEEGKMQSSDIGKVLDEQWLKTFEMRTTMNLEMGAYIVMPNHFHAIIIIGHNNYNTAETSGNVFGGQSANLPSIMGGFKSAVTRLARIYNPDFAWQPRYHDHIIRTAESYDNITQYIISNPEKWQEDRFFR